MPSRKRKGKEGSSSSGVRGRNIYIPVLDEDQKPVVHRIGHRETKKVNKIISKIVCNMYPGVYGKYSDFPEETQLLFKNEFLKYYRFPKDKNIDEVWKTFSRIGNKGIQKNLNKYKKAARELHGDTTQKTKQHQAPSTFDWVKPNVSKKQGRIRRKCIHVYLSICTIANPDDPMSYSSRPIPTRTRGKKCLNGQGIRVVG